MSKFLAVHADPIAGCTFFVVDDTTGAETAQFCAKCPLPQGQEIAIKLLKENQLSNIKIMKRNNYPEEIMEKLSTIPGVALEVME